MKDCEFEVLPHPLLVT